MLVIVAEYINADVFMLWVNGIHCGYINVCSNSPAKIKIVLLCTRWSYGS